MNQEISPNYPSVGVILTTYNGQNFLAEQLDSLFAQRRVRVHIYVFDDQSTDDTLHILERYSEANPNQMTVFQNTHNSGGTGLNIFRNLVLVPQQHDFFALADQDDIWLEEKLERAVVTMKRDGTDLYFSNLTAWDGKETLLGTIKKSSPFAKYDHLFGGGSAGCTYVMSAGFISELTRVVSATDLSKVRRISHDWIIYFFARHNRFSVSVTSDSLIKYRIHAESQYGNMSLGGAAGWRRKIARLRQGFLREQIQNTTLFAREGSSDWNILQEYAASPLSRLKILMRYNFSLARTKPRFLALVVASFLWF